MFGAEALVGVLVLVAGPLGAGPGADPAPLRIGASPARLRLAEGSRATVRVPCTRAVPALGASGGRIEALREVASGVYEAEYVPPESLDPQVTFVTARCEAAFGWAPITLVGVRDIAIPARYGTPVTVSVDGERFGPAAADATGRAPLRVAVPPGARFASWRNQRIDLGVRVQPFVHVALDRAELDANLVGTVSVHVLAVDERGTPLPAAGVTLSASEGTVRSRLEVKGGVARTSWSLAPGAVREATLTARLAGSPPVSTTVALARVAGPPRKLGLGVSRTVMVAGDSEELEVTTLVEDAGGNPTDAEVTLVASGGTLADWERAGPGRHVGHVLVPSRRSGPPEVELEAAAGALAARRTVALVPGPPREARVDVGGELAADGRPRELRLTIVDAYENRVDVRDAPLVTAGRGEVDEPVRYAPGAYRLSYRAPLGDHDFVDVVRVSVGSIESTTPLHVRALGGGLTLAPKLGFILGPDGLRPLAGGAELGVWGPWLGGLGLLLDARAFALDKTDAVGRARVRTEASFLALEASLAWRRPSWGGIGWLAAGGGAARTASKVSATGQGGLTAESWAPVARASAGWGRPLGPGMPFGELAGAWMGDPADGPIHGPLRSLTFSVGYRLDVL